MQETLPQVQLDEDGLVLRSLLSNKELMFTPFADDDDSGATVLNVFERGNHKAVMALNKEQKHALGRYMLQDMMDEVASVWNSSTTGPLDIVNAVGPLLRAAGYELDY
jgi:hypothetical protein